MIADDLFLGKVIFCFAVEHESVVIFRNESFDLAVLAVVELEEHQQFSQHGAIEGFEFVVFEGRIKICDGVISELVVEIEVPVQAIHLNKFYRFY